MAIDMNVDVGALIKGLFSKDKGGNKPANPYLKIITAVLVLVTLIGAYIFFHYLPTKEDLRIKNHQISQVESLKLEISDLNDLIDKTKLDLETAQKDYEKLTKLFHTDKELEDLYRHISMLALRNNLMVSKIEKGSEKPVLELSLIHISEPTRPY